jgi:hypothetical protein
MTPLDELGMAITNAGYTWTPEMRKAYEKGVRQQKKEWVGLTDEEVNEIYIENLTTANNFVRAAEAKLKEKNGG